MIKDVYINRIIDLKSRIEKEKSYIDGVKEGKRQVKIEVMLRMYDKGYDIRYISSIINISEFDIDNIINDYEIKKKSGINILSIVNLR